MYASAQTTELPSATLVIAKRKRTPQMNAQHVSQVTPQLFALSLADYDVKGASINCSRDGTKFAFTIGPLLDTTLSVLNAVAQGHGRIYLCGCGEPLPFDLVAIERKGPRSAQVVGRIVDGALDAMR